MPSLRERQSEFAAMVAVLILWGKEQGYEMTFGHAYRCEDCQIGMKNSLHKERLAIDLNLFRDGKYLRETEDYLPLGQKWESMGGTWGGRFDDGMHFSLPLPGDPRK